MTLIEQLDAALATGDFELIVEFFTDNAPAIRAALELAEVGAMEIARLRGLLGQCFVLAGADTDGDPPERHADDAVRAVGDLRLDYDENEDWQGRALAAEKDAARYLSALALARPYVADAHNLSPIKARREEIRQVIAQLDAAMGGGE